MNNDLNTYLDKFNINKHGESILGIDYSQDTNWLPIRYRGLWERLSTDIIQRHLRDYRLMYPKSLYLGSEINSANIISKNGFGVVFVQFEDGITERIRCSDRDLIRYVDETSLEVPKKVKESILKRDVGELLKMDIGELFTKRKNNDSDDCSVKVYNLNTHRYMYQILESCRFLEYLFQIYINMPYGCVNAFEGMPDDAVFEFNGDISHYELGKDFKQCSRCGYNFNSSNQTVCLKCGRPLN